MPTSHILEKKPIADYFSLNAIGTALFTLLGLIAAGQLLTYMVAGTQAVSEGLQSLFLRNSVAHWFTSAVFAMTALVAYSSSGFAAKKAHSITWKIMAAFMLILSCQEVAIMHDVTGWTYFLNIDSPQAMAWAVGIGAIPFIAFGFFLRNALSGSSDAARCIVWGAVLFLMGSGAEAVFLLLSPQFAQSNLLPLQIVLQYAVKMLGAVVLLTGFIMHERYLQRQIQRVKAGLPPKKMPRITSRTAEWALRMIGTPTRDEKLMQEEAERAQKKKKDAAASLGTDSDEKGAK